MRIICYDFSPLMKAVPLFPCFLNSQYAKYASMYLYVLPEIQNLNQQNSYWKKRSSSLQHSNSQLLHSFNNLIWVHNFKSLFKCCGKEACLLPSNLSTFSTALLLNGWLVLTSQGNKTLTKYSFTQLLFNLKINSYIAYSPKS